MRRHRFADRQAMALPQRCDPTAGRDVRVSGGRLELDGTSPELSRGYAGAYGRPPTVASCRPRRCAVPGRWGDCPSGPAICAQRHGLDAERQDADAAGLDLERRALVVGPASSAPCLHRPAFHACPFLVKVFPVVGVAVPDFHRRPEAAAVLELAVPSGSGCRNRRSGATSRRGSSLPLGIRGSPAQNRCCPRRRMRAHGDSLVVDGTDAGACPTDTPQINRFRLRGLAGALWAWRPSVCNRLICMFK